MKASIIIRAYNAEATIARAIESALAQDFPADEYEVFIVDDGSTDGTAAVIGTYTNDARIRVMRQTNSGIVKAANVGFREARGTYVTLLDSDDEFAPEALSNLVGELEKDPSLAFVYGDYFEEFRGAVKRVEVPHLMKAIADAVLFRRELLLKESGFKGDTIFPEYDLYLRTWGRWKSAHISKFLSTYHRRTDSLTGSISRVQDSIEALKQKYPEHLEEVEQIRSYRL